MAIDVDFEKANKQADQLSEVAQQLKTLGGNNFEEIMSVLNQGWKGEAADAFLIKCQKLSASIKDNAAKLEQVAEEVRNSAKNLYTQEQRNIQTSTERTYQ